MIYSLIISVIFTFSSLWIYLNIRKSRLNCIAYFVLAETVVVGLIAYLSIHYLSGAGINAAAIYHLKYGFHGYGYKAYGNFIWGILAAIAVGTTVAALVAFLQWRRQKQHQAATRIAYMLMLAALTANPAVYDLVRVQDIFERKSSDFHQYYETPHLVRREGEQALNLVYIYAEGFERTYFNEERFPGLIKELRKFEKEGTSFVNIYETYLTGWTMAGLVASQCGVPLFTPSNGNSMSGADAYLPGAIGLSDLLKREGYHLAYMGGARTAFAGKGKFLATHQFDEILGLEELLPRLPDKSYISGWGLYDDTLFDLAFSKYTELSARRQNFALFLLTLDTHFPVGGISASVSNIKYGDGNRLMLNAIAASDSLIADFVRRIRKTPSGSDTVVVIASDHLGAGFDSLRLGDRAKRSNMFIVLHPKQPGKGFIDTPGSTLDIGATLIPQLGFRGALGLGRNLLDDKIDLAERRHIRAEQNLRSWGSDIMQFWNFPRIVKQMKIDVKAGRMKIDDRVFSIPVLVELTDDLSTVPKFEFDASPMHKSLARYVEEIRHDAPFLLITTKKRAQGLLRSESGGEDDWYFVIGRKGRELKVRGIADQLTLTMDYIKTAIGPPVIKDPTH